MKSLEEIRDLFIKARELAKEASPARSDEAAGYLSEISDHCKMLYETADSFLERAKCRNLYESIDNVCSILRSSGFFNTTVMGFFGLLNKGVKGAPSFADISAGLATVKAPAPEAPLNVKEEPVLPDLPEIPPAPKAKKKQAEPKSDPACEMTDEPKADVPSVPEKAKENADGEIPRQKNEMEVESLDGFIGQEHIVKQLKAEIEAAKILGKKHLDHIMLFGNKGLGKSTLMKLIAKELGVAFEFIDCTSLMNDVKSQRMFHEFFVNVSQLGKPVVIALDEIHALPGRLQSCLLSLLNDRVYSYLTESGTKNVPIPEFTFIGATTDYDAVLSTLKDRCTNLTFFMKDYTRDELRRIMANKLASVGLHANETVIDACVNRCRCSVRDVVAIVKGLQTSAVIAKTDEVTLEMAEENFRRKDFDPIGLRSTEIRILKAIASEPRGTISAETLAARVNVELGLLAKEYEPYLLKIGFISVTNKGRTLTQKAEDYLRYGYFDFGDGITVGEKPEPSGEMNVEAVSVGAEETDDGADTAPYIPECEE